MNCFFTCEVWGDDAAISVHKKPPSVETLSFAHVQEWYESIGVPSQGKLFKKADRPGFDLIFDMKSLPSLE
ncbi:hypothetical protein BsIDN1_18150 [Bacillus safensis]|uniref:Uncharacterized protein n=1 Tax=Bacillus safensis TaxID=561879 RepID=A0A5S9M3N5_BACIA|nr:hypothetical protein BsIDN1_18150 [Bacillus safensis]